MVALRQDCRCCQNYRLRWIGPTRTVFARIVLSELSSPQTLKVRNHTRMFAVAGMVVGQGSSIAIEEHLERNPTDLPAASRNAPTDPMLIACFGRCRVSICANSSRKAW